MSENFPPANTCDCHVHTVGPFDKFPLSANRPYTPHEATYADLAAMMAQLGTTRTVIVQPSIYGTDNACTMDAVDQLKGNGRAVIVVAPDAPKDELASLLKRGARGLRVNAASVGETSPEKIRERLTATAKQAADNGYHVQLFINAATLMPLADFIPTLPVTVVIDHFGLVSMGPEGAAQAEMMVRLLGTGRVWVKLSGSYRVSKTNMFDPKIPELARKFAAVNPEHVVWASDWPHTPGGTAANANPHAVSQMLDVDTPKLLDFVKEWFPDAAMRQKLLVDNPAKLYGW